MFDRVKKHLKPIGAEYRQIYRAILKVFATAVSGPDYCWGVSRLIEGLIIAYISSKMHRQADQEEILESKLKIVDRLYVKNVLH